MNARIYLGAAVLAASLAIGAATTFAFDSSKLTPGVVVEGAEFQSSKLTPGIVVEVSGFNSSKLSVGIVVEYTNMGQGSVPPAPLTHW